MEVSGILAREGNNQTTNTMETFRVKWSGVDTVYHWNMKYERPFRVSCGGELLIKAKSCDDAIAQFRQNPSNRCVAVTADLEKSK